MAALIGKMPILPTSGGEEQKERNNKCQVVVSAHGDTNWTGFFLLFLFLFFLSFFISIFLLFLL